jgi:hypothetical protein
MNEEATEAAALREPELHCYSHVACRSGTAMTTTDAR